MINYKHTEITALNVELISNRADYDGKPLDDICTECCTRLLASGGIRHRLNKGQERKKISEILDAAGINYQEPRRKRAKAGTSTEALAAALVSLIQDIYDDPDDPKRWMMLHVCDSILLHKATDGAINVLIKECRTQARTRSANPSLQHLVEGGEQPCAK